MQVGLLCHSALCVVILHYFDKIASVRPVLKNSLCRSEYSISNVYDSTGFSNLGDPVPDAWQILGAAVQLLTNTFLVLCGLNNWGFPIPNGYKSLPGSAEFN